MKTMILMKRIDASPITVSSMYQAVVSPIAQEAWTKGRCNPPPSGFQTKPIQQFELSF